MLVALGFSDELSRVGARAPALGFEAFGMALCQAIVERLASGRPPSPRPGDAAAFARYQIALAAAYQSLRGPDFVTPGDFLRSSSLVDVAIIDRAAWKRGLPLPHSGREEVQRELARMRQSPVGAEPRP
jgi:hypothetical protein